MRFNLLVLLQLWVLEPALEVAAHEQEAFLADVSAAPNCTLHHVGSFLQPAPPAKPCVSRSGWLFEQVEQHTIKTLVQLGSFMSALPVQYGLRNSPCNASCILISHLHHFLTTICRVP